MDTPCLTGSWGQQGDYTILYKSFYQIVSAVMLMWSNYFRTGLSWGGMCKAHVWTGGGGFLPSCVGFLQKARCWDGLGQILRGNIRAGTWDCPLYLDLSSCPLYRLLFWWEVGREGSVLVFSGSCSVDLRDSDHGEGVGCLKQVIS